MEQFKNTVLLVMDMQAGIVGMLPDTTALLAKNKKAIETARKRNIPVVYIVVGFRPGAPEVSNNNKTFANFAERMKSVNMTQFMTVHPEITPQEGEVVVAKRRVSAFAGSDLEVILRAYEAKHLILTGIATSGVVLSTTREAADKDFQLTILSDCCADRDEEVNRVLLTRVLSHQADVMTVDEWALVN